MVWYGRSPDRRRKVEVLQARNKQQSVRIDGKQGQPYDTIGVGALVFSPNSRRLAFPARRGAGWHVVLDGQEGEAFHGVGEIVFSPDSRHVAYLARRGGKWHIVRDGKVGAAFHGIFRRKLAFSPDSRRLVCVVMDSDRRARVVLDGQAGPAHQQISGLRFGPGGRVAYIGVDEGRARVVLDGRAGPAHDEIAEVALAGGGRVAYLARRVRSWIAVVDGVEQGNFDGAAGLLFSEDSKHLAFAALRGPRAMVVRDGKEGQPHDAVRVNTLAWLPGGGLLYVARRRQGTRLGFTVVHNDQPGPLMDKIQPLQIAGARWGYIGRVGKKHQLMLDGKPVAKHSWAAGLAFSPDGKRHAYLLRQDNGVAVKLGKKIWPFEVVVRGTLVFSHDAKHWACLAGQRDERRLIVVVDGASSSVLERKELIAARLADPHRSEAELLRSWVLAELAQAVGGPAASKPRPPAQKTTSAKKETGGAATKVQKVTTVPPLPD